VDQNRTKINNIEEAPLGQIRKSLGEFKHGSTSESNDKKKNYGTKREKGGLKGSKTARSEAEISELRNKMPASGNLRDLFKESAELKKKN
jgi:hypothetical protein